MPDDEMIREHAKRFGYSEAFSVLPHAKVIEAMTSALKSRDTFASMIAMALANNREAVDRAILELQENPRLQ